MCNTVLKTTTSFPHFSLLQWCVGSVRDNVTSLLLLCPVKGSEAKG
jgi:hypothetical protein